MSNVVELCQALVRFDTSNFGGGVAQGEREAAEFVAEQLADVGIEPHVLESAPRRTNVVARVPGSDPTAPALLVHGHLDVVPAVAGDWSVDPFAAAIEDGFLIGRGTADMKGACATTLSVVRSMLRSGQQPRRDIVVAFTADEEDTGECGAFFLVKKHPDLFDGVTEGVSESGGYTLHLPEGKRIYPVAVGERGSAWMRLTARGTAGHASKANPDNAVLHLTRAMARLGEHQWPLRPSPGVVALLHRLGEILDVPVDLDDIDALLDRLGAASPLVASTLRCSTAPTMLEAGYKVNVVPGTAVGHVDGRILPECEQEFHDTVDGLLGPFVECELVNHGQPLAAPFDSPLMDVISDAITAEDPGSHVLPFVMSGGTDAKAFAELGIAGYGFAPVGLTPELTYGNLAHGVDERVPVAGLEFGARVFERFLTAC